MVYIVQITSQPTIQKTFFLAKKANNDNNNNYIHRRGRCGYIKRNNTIMGWPFCPHCRATLRVDGSGAVECDVCQYKSNLDAYQQTQQLPTTTSYSTNRPIPIWAKSPEEQAILRGAANKEPTRATIEEPCIKCNHPEVGYYTVQLRSVDEGQTVFYECPNCKHTWSINN